MMDAVTNALIETIGDAGFNVQLRAKNGLHVVEATDRRTRETLLRSTIRLMLRCVCRVRRPS